MPKSDFVIGKFNSTLNPWAYKLQPINFPTPERDIEIISVPGRNGDLFIDHGNYKNVETVVNIAVEGNFLQRYDSFRNAIYNDSEQGYLRVVDGLYPNEYRLAIVKSIEVGTPTISAGTIDVTLSVKPQRYFTTPDTTITPSATAQSYVTASGNGKQIFNSAYQSWSGEAEYYNRDLTVIDTQNFGQDYKVRAVYPANKYPGDLYCEYTGRNPLTNSDPTGTDSWSAVLNEPLIEAEINYISPLASGKWHTGTANYNWLIIETPMYYEILDGSDNVIGKLFTTKTDILPGMWGANPSPLIKMTIPGTAMHGQPVMRINDDMIIRLATPSSYTIGTDSFSITEVYFDCELYNAYTIIPGTTTLYSLNKYVTAEGDVRMDGRTNMTVEINDNITSAEITPRWWKI